MRIVVTGGAGFIGANLCCGLDVDDRFDRVVALDDLSTGDDENLKDTGVELVEGSILDEELLTKLVSEADAVVHLAARPSVPRSIEDPWTAHQVNATGTVRVLEAARHAAVSQVIVASSSSVYGANPAQPKTEDVSLAPMSPYSASKVATEAYAGAYAHSFGLNVLTFRFFNVFGPFQRAGHAYAAVVPAFVAAALADKPLTIFGDGEQTRDFTYVGSVVEVLTDALERRVVSSGPINLAFGTRTSILELAALLSEIAGSDLAVDHKEPRPGDVRHSQADNRRLMELFPGMAAPQLKEALRDTWEWYRSTT